MEESVDMLKTVTTETIKEEEFSHLENAQSEEGILCTCGGKQGCVLHSNIPLEGLIPKEEDNIPDAPDIIKDEKEVEEDVNQSPALQPLDLKEKSVTISFLEGVGIPETKFEGEWRGLFLKRAISALKRGYRIYQKERIKDGRREREGK